MLRDYIPTSGDRSARNRWRKLREEALELSVIAALAWTKWIEMNVNLAVGVVSPDRWVAWFMVAIALTGWYVHAKRIRQAADDAAEAVEDVVESEES